MSCCMLSAMLSASSPMSSANSVEIAKTMEPSTVSSDFRSSCMSILMQPVRPTATNVASAAAPRSRRVRITGPSHSWRAAGCTGRSTFVRCGWRNRLERNTLNFGAVAIVDTGGARRMEPKLTTKSQEALAAALQGAASAGNAQLEPVHLLAALLAQPGGVAGGLLDAVGVDRPALAHRVSAIRTTLPTASSRPPATPPGWASSAASRCTGSSWAFPALAAPCRAAASASWDLVVSFGSMRRAPPVSTMATAPKLSVFRSSLLRQPHRTNVLRPGRPAARQLWEGPVMRTRRLLGAAALATFVAVGLTGCIKMDMQLDLKSDDTVDGSMIFAISSEVAQMAGQDAATLAEQF